MKTILVPVDFSKSSKAAAAYAVALAKAMSARIILLSVINASSSSKTLANWRNLEASMVKSAKKDGDDLIKALNAGKVRVEHQSVLGYAVTDLIEQFTEKNNIALIVMGSKGATGLKKTFVGSNAASMIEKSRVPVIVVPEKAEFRKLKNVVYATDMKHFESEMELVDALTKPCNSRINVLHVTPVKYSKLKRLELENELLQYPNAALHISKSPDIVDAIEAFVEVQKADLIILFTHTLDFYEKLFGKSIARQVAFKSTHPLLTFNKSNI